MNDTIEKAVAGQVSNSAADIYEEFFVPALFGAWAAPLCSAARLGPGHKVLDVACGTGATTREAATQVRPDGHAIGLDINEGMLTVARRQAPEIEFLSGRAEELPFDDAAFDAVVCQFALMFFEDRQAALSEVARVLRPGGRIAVSVWDNVESSPGYARMIALIEKLAGTEAADALRAPFCLGDIGELQGLLERSGLRDAQITAKSDLARFPSITDWVATEVRGWTLAELINDEQFRTLTEAANGKLSEFVGPDGSVSFAAPALIAAWTKPD